jgi:hypothetical protein
MVALALHAQLGLVLIKLGYFMFYVLFMLFYFTRPLYYD